MLRRSKIALKMLRRPKMALKMLRRPKIALTMLRRPLSLRAPNQTQTSWLCSALATSIKKVSDKRNAYAASRAAL